MLEERVMKSKLLFLLVVFCSLGLLVHPGCKTAGDGEYVLTVTVTEGITGTPAAGSYSYSDGDLINYGYTPQSGYSNLTVQLDGVILVNSGVIAMDADHSMTVTADKLFNVNGDWAGVLSVSGHGDYALDVSFNGGYYNGSASGFFDGSSGSGDYTITNGSIEFNLVMLSVLRFYFTGTIDNDNRMSGSWDSNYGPAGTWYLDRI